MHDFTYEELEKIRLAKGLLIRRYALELGLEPPDDPRVTEWYEQERQRSIQRALALLDEQAVTF